MGALDYKQFTERHRPHIHEPGAVLFVTYRLAGSIPQAVVRQYRAKSVWSANELARVLKLSANRESPELRAWLERIDKLNREWFAKFEEVLHGAGTGPMWMKDARVAKTGSESIHRLDGEAYRLDAFCVMSNHVHVVFQPLLTELEARQAFEENGNLASTSEHAGLARIMHILKGSSARECNLILGRGGRFWEHESFDRVVRRGKFNATIRYVVNNPIKAGLVKDWRLWPWTYCRSELLEILND
jgi:putative transposase